KVTHERCGERVTTQQITAGRKDSVLRTDCHPDRRDDSGRAFSDRRQDAERARPSGAVSGQPGGGSRKHSQSRGAQNRGGAARKRQLRPADSTADPRAERYVPAEARKEFLRRSDGRAPGARGDGGPAGGDEG